MSRNLNTIAAEIERLLIARAAESEIERQRRRAGEIIATARARANAPDYEALAAGGGLVGEIVRILLQAQQRADGRTKQ